MPAIFFYRRQKEKIAGMARSYSSLGHVCGVRIESCFLI